MSTQPEYDAFEQPFRQDLPLLERLLNEPV
jgi:hypothetical protein